VPAIRSSCLLTLLSVDQGVGSQNSTLVSTSGNTIAWNTDWTWANGPNDVKSYANVESNTAKGMLVRPTLLEKTRHQANDCSGH
jgi:hypothetical protein